jgi:tetratricopeptide (TPR) repeat protein
MARNRLTKKQLQTDELEHALVDARDFVSSHRSETTKWAVIAGVVLLAGAGLWYGLNLRANRLGTRLGHAVSLFDAPLVTDGGSVATGQKVFKDAAERTAELKKELKALATDSPSSTPGQAAALLMLGMEGSNAASGTTLDAVKSFAQKGSGSVASGIAAVSLLDAEAAAGRTKDAIETAKRYLDSTDSPLPKDVLIFTLARLYEKAGQNADAKTYYQRVVTDFPDSSFRGDAQQKAASLS